jgi:hypothetical protein
VWRATNYNHAIVLRVSFTRREASPDHACACVGAYAKARARCRMITNKERRAVLRKQHDAVAGTDPKRPQQFTMRHTPFEAINNTDRVHLMRVDGKKLMAKSPGVIVPMTGATSIVEFELVKAD